MAADAPVGQGDEEELVYDNRPIHIYPMFGRQHEMSVKCWCEPQPDRDPTIRPGSLWIHRSDN